MCEPWSGLGPKATALEGGVLRRVSQAAVLDPKKKEGGEAGPHIAWFFNFGKKGVFSPPQLWLPGISLGYVLHTQPEQLPGEIRKTILHVQFV